MELKKEDFILVTALDGQKVLGLKPDYFDDKPIEEVVKEAMEEKKTVELIIDDAEALEQAKADAAAKLLHEKEEAELAEIEKQELIEKKKAELAKLLEE